MKTTLRNQDQHISGTLQVTTQTGRRDRAARPRQWRECLGSAGSPRGVRGGNREAVGEVPREGLQNCGESGIAGVSVVADEEEIRQAEVI